MYAMAAEKQSEPDLMKGILDFAGRFYQADRVCLFLHDEQLDVWQDVLAVHLAALLLRVVALIDRVVLTQILVERDTDHAVAHDHALVQSRDLRIDAGHTDIRECLLEPRESVAETRIQIVDVGILGLHVGNDTLQDRVLVELEQL